MKLKDIIKASAEILNVQDDAILKRCANLVLSNIAANYIDCVATQNFDVVDDRIYYDQFDKTFLKIKSINCDYSLFIDYIKVPNGQRVVEYCYIPAFENDTDEIVIPGLSESCFVFGVLTEYAIISGMMNEARIWGEKFAAGLFSSNPKNKNIVMPRR